MSKQVYFVGTDHEVAHHAAPLIDSIKFEIVPPDQVTKVAKRGDLAIFYSEHFDRFRHAIEQLQQSGVATLYMIDGILEWRNAWVNRPDEPACPFTMRPVLCDKVACIGASQARTLRSWGNVGKVEIVGIPRLEKLRAMKPRQRRYDDKFCLMVATAKCPSYTDADHDNLRRCLTDIRDYCNHSTGITVVWRLTADWDKRLGIENHLSCVKGIELAEQLTQVDAVVTTPSTTALESMLLGIPTAVVDYNNCPSYCNFAWKITAANQVENQINDMKSPPHEKLQFQQMMLQDSLYLGSSAVDRMRELIQKMLDPRVWSPESNCATPLLPPPKACGIDFDSATIFSEYEEFRMHDQLRLQTELAHSRREINHLTSQLLQLRSELGEAHRIFDEINGHPIAGPIVKLRQKIISFAKKIRRNPTHPEIP